MIDLGTLGTGTFSYGFAINDAGHVVGHSATVDPGTIVHAFLYDSTMHDLGTLGGNESSALGVNDSGQVVGYSNLVVSGPVHAFLHENGTMSDLGTLGGNSSQAYGINEAGQIVGWSDILGNTAEHAILRTADGMVDLNTLLDSSGVGWSLRRATAINDHGWIVGLGRNPSGENHAFLLTPVPEPSSIALAILAITGASLCRPRLRS
jgi:probable HAF family extracellular repeat protein